MTSSATFYRGAGNSAPDTSHYQTACVSSRNNVFGTKFEFLNGSKQINAKAPEYQVMSKLSLWDKILSFFFKLESKEGGFLESKVGGLEWQQTYVWKSEIDNLLKFYGLDPKAKEFENSTVNERIRAAWEKFKNRDIDRSL